MFGLEKGGFKEPSTIFRTRLFGLERGGFKEPSTMFRTRLARTGERGGMGLFGAC